jgi:hypothetical protein
MSLDVLTNKFAQLSIIDKAMMIHSGVTAVVDPTIWGARVQMKSVQLPTYYFDIFRKLILEDAKALFSPLLHQDPMPGFGISALARKCQLTLEGYFVDKHLSGSISSVFMTEVLGRIDHAVNQCLQGKRDDKSCYGRGQFYTEIIQSFGTPGDNFAKSFRDVNVEVFFMFRIANRLRVQEETKLYKELSLPQFSNPSYLSSLKDEMSSIEERGCGLLGLSCNIPKEEIEDLKLYKDYLTKLFDLRDQRMLKILKDAFQKDLAVRTTNPSAPLTHLVTLEGYEKDISKQRQILCLKVILAAFAIFFFTKACLIYLARSKT